MHSESRMEGLISGLTPPGTEPARCAERSLDETDHLGRDWVSPLPKQVSILRQISVRLTFIVLKKDPMTYI